MSRFDPNTVEINDVRIFKNEFIPNGGMTIDWVCNMGFGELSWFISKDGKLHAETECMASNGDKEFIKAVMNRLVDLMEVDN